MPTKTQIDKARMIGAYVTEMLTQHADLVDDVVINIAMWPVYQDNTSPEQALAYVEAFAERYGVQVQTTNMNRGTLATVANEAFGKRAAVTASVHGPRRPAAEV